MAEAVIKLKMEVESEGELGILFDVALLAIGIIIASNFDTTRWTH